MVSECKPPVAAVESVIFSAKRSSLLQAMHRTPTWMGSAMKVGPTKNAFDQVIEPATNHLEVVETWNISQLFSSETSVASAGAFQIFSVLSTFVAGWEKLISHVRW